MLKLGRIVLYAFLFCAACALTANAQETKKDTTQRKNPRSKGARTHPAEPGSDQGVIVSVDTEKNTITVKDDEDKEHTFTADEHTKLKGPRGGTLHNLKDKQIKAGRQVSWMADKDGKLKELWLGADTKRIRVPIEGKDKEEAKEKPKEKPKEEKK
jgi:hypothetical protein